MVRLNYFNFRQEQLLNELNSSIGRTFRDRKVVWIQDPQGGAGKSTFLKYLALNQKDLVVKKLPLDKPDRLRMMVCKIVQRETVDAFVFDFTRTLGTDTHIENLFQFVEEVKNGHVVSAMFGNPLEVIMTNPFVIIFTNNDISNYCQYLSMDRWQAYEIQNGELYEIKKTANYAMHDLNSRYIRLDEQKKKSNPRRQPRVDYEKIRIERKIDLDNVRYINYILFYFLSQPRAP